MKWTWMGAGLVMALAASSPADLVINFDDGVNPFSSGTISEVRSFAGGKSLYLAAGNNAVFNLPEPYLSHNGTVTVKMMVYDMGKWIDTSVTGAPTTERGGPRWGINAGTGAALEYIGASIYHATFLPSSYGYGLEPATNASSSRFGSWWSVTAYAGRQVDSLGDGGSNDGSGWVPSTEGVGRWTEWNFEMDPDGTSRVWRTGGSTVAMTVVPGGATQIFLGGGSANGSTRLGNLFVDSITIIPEPSLLALLGLGGLLIWRQRRH